MATACYCPICTARLKAPAELAGKKLNCPKWGKAIRLPETSELLPVGKLEGQKSKRRLLKAFTVIGLVFATLLALAVGFWIYERRISPEMSVSEILAARSFRGDISAEQRWGLLEHWSVRMYPRQHIRNASIQGTISDRDAEPRQKFIDLEELAMHQYLLGLINKPS